MFYSIARNIFLGVLITCALLYVLFLAGFRVNISHSLPMGIWHIERVGKPLKRGDVVWFCPPDTKLFHAAFNRSYIPRGSCPNHMAHLLKPIAALPGDRVLIDAEGVKVNDLRVQNSQIRKQDNKGNPLPHLALRDDVVRHQNIWLISSYDRNSFDSRYFGPISLKSIEAKAIPVLVFN